MKTKVLECESSLISPCGLTFSSISKICSHTIEYDYLVGEFLWPMCVNNSFGCLFFFAVSTTFCVFALDVMGVMTGISAER